MRASTAFFYAVVFCAATFILYFMMELTGNGPASLSNRRKTTSVSPEEELAVDILERKLARLEDTIQRNQDLVVSLQANLTRLLIDKAPLLQDEVQELRGKTEKPKRKSTGSDVIEANTAVAVVPAKKKRLHPVENADGQCPASDWSPATTDIQMFDVYEALEFDNPDGGVWKQGFELPYKPEQWTVEQPLQVFIVPHSHNDPGWLRTFEQYFEEQTKLIFDLLVQKMTHNSRRKFIWAEVSYLALWWSTANDEKKAIFKKLVKSGQVELVTGGWVMNDEANSHYSAMINQMVEGHEWIKNHIGPHAVPKHGWSIDPFGLSSTMAYVLKMNQFDGMLIQRAHYSVKKHLGKKKSLEFTWRQAWDQSDTTDMLTHLMPFYSYDVPHTCGPDPKICCQFDFRRMPASSGKQISCPWGIPPRGITQGNVQERAETLLDQYRKKAQLTQTNVVLAPVGDDFRYDSALEWDRQFQNYEKLIKYYSSRPDLNVRIQFGTLKDYFDALKKDVVDRKLTLPTLAGDFFTYADRDDHYWSGYYTSRPFYKSLERRLEARLRSAEIAYSLALARHLRDPKGLQLPSPNDILTKLAKSRRNLALFQHHDGVTGTAKTHVMNDYAAKMTSAVTNCNEVLAGSLGFLLEGQGEKKGSLRGLTLGSGEKFDLPHRPSEREVLQISLNGRRVVVFNSLGQSREEVVTVRVDNGAVMVAEEFSGENVVSQINPVWQGRSALVSVDSFDLVFVAKVPALGVKSFLIKSSSLSGNVHAAHRPSDGLSQPASLEFYSTASVHTDDKFTLFPVKSDTPPKSITLESDALKLDFNGKTGFLQKVTSKDGKVSLDVEIKFVKYGTTAKEDKSGAYLFLPDGPAQDILLEDIPTTDSQQAKASSRAPLIRVLRGPVFSSVQLVLPQLTHTVRLFHSVGPSSRFPEIINRVDISRASNYELAMHLTTPLKTEGFLTDLNGFQLIRRKTHAKLPLQANYYPMPGVAVLEDDDYRLSLVGRQPLGVASLTKGTLEVMLDRRLDQDDNRGLGQPVKDNVPGTVSTFRLIVETNRPSAGSISLRNTQSHPTLSLLSHLTHLSLSNPYVTLSDSAHLEPVGSVQPDFPGLAIDLPCDVHLLNLRTAVASESENDTTIASPFSSVPGDYSGATSLLLFHRLGVDCRRPINGLDKCQPLTGKLDLKRTFQSLLALPFLEEGSPSPLTKASLAAADGKIILHPMHVQAFRIPLV